MSTEVLPPEANINGAQAHNGQLAKALLAAQMEMPAVKPDATNPHFKSKFVSLGLLISKARPVLNKHGIALAQFPSADQHGKPTLVTILMHESGERLEFAAPLLLTKQDPQGQGSAITYMRRYALASAVGISDQEDDDGNAGSGRGKQSGNQPERITPDEVEAITSHLEKSGRSAADLKEKLAEVGVEGKLTSVKQALGLCTPEQAVAISAWIGGRS